MDEEIKQLQGDVTEIKAALKTVEADRSEIKAALKTMEAYRLESAEFRKTVLAWMERLEKQVPGQNSGSSGSGGSVFEHRTPFTGDKPSDGGVPFLGFTGSLSDLQPVRDLGLGRLDTKPEFSPEGDRDDANKNSSGVAEVSTYEGVDFAKMSFSVGKSELKQILKQMTFTRSESQGWIDLLHSRITEKEPSSELSPTSRVLKSPMGSPQHQHREATIENLPEELLTNIFIRLSAKQLSQMRSVSKSYDALLSDSSFIKSHLNRSIQNNHHQMILLAFHANTFYIEEEKEPFEICTRPTSPNLQVTTDFIKLPVNLQLQNEKFIRVIGSVNGLVCSSYDGNSSIQIWNPSLSSVLTLPPYSTPSDDCKPIRVYFGFGFDPKTDDYKVVKLKGVNGRPKCEVLYWLGVEIYSMRRGTWEVITERFPSHITSIQECDYVCGDGHDGYLHWLGYEGFDSCQDSDSYEDGDYTPSIVAFDLESETFREIHLPHSLQDHDHVNMLGVYSKKLCVISCQRDNKIEVWVMDEYGVAESWVKRHVFSQSSLGPSPYGFTSHNEFVDCFLLFHNPVTRVCEDDFSNLYEEYNKIVEYVDSLVWVTPPKPKI